VSKKAYKEPTNLQQLTKTAQLKRQGYIDKCRLASRISHNFWKTLSVSAWTEY